MDAFQTDLQCSNVARWHMVRRESGVDAIGDRHSSSREREVHADRSSKSGQVVGGSDIGHEADRGLGHRERDALGRDLVSSTERQASAAAHADAVQQHQQRVWQPCQCRIEYVLLANESSGGRQVVPAQHHSFERERRISRVRNARSRSVHVKIDIVATCVLPWRGCECHRLHRRPDDPPWLE